MASQESEQFSSLLKNLMDTPEPEPERSFEDIRKELAEKSLEPKAEPESKPAAADEEEPAEDDESGQEALNALLNAYRQQPPASQSYAPSVLDSRLNFSEVSAVKQQLAGCWNVLSGARYAENLTVEVILYMNPDRTVRNAIIADQMRYNRDGVFRAAADSALRALKMEPCRVLNLPPQKYEQWKKTVITFDPRAML